MILVRTTFLDDRTQNFAERLADAAQQSLCYVIDGRHQQPNNVRQSTIPITRELCASYGLYCPPDFAWRCGDYGLYIARERFPNELFFWQLEFDVRFHGLNEAEFFRFFEKDVSDLLAVHLRPAGPDYRWYTFGAGRNVAPWRCLFPLTRFSASALDVLVERRRKHGLSRQRRSTWPNDEVFVATTLAQENMKIRDFNSFGTTFYTESTFNFHHPIRGEDLAAETTPAIYHPVLFGADYDRKVLRTARRPTPLKTWPWIEQRVRRSFNHLFSW